MERIGQNENDHSQQGVRAQHVNDVDRSDDGYDHPTDDHRSHRRELVHPLAVVREQVDQL